MSKDIGVRFKWVLPIMTKNELILLIEVTGSETIRSVAVDEFLFMLVAVVMAHHNFLLLFWPH